MAMAAPPGSPGPPSPPGTAGTAGTPQTPRTSNPDPPPTPIPITAEEAMGVFGLEHAHRWTDAAGVHLVFVARLPANDRTRRALLEGGIRIEYCTPKNRMYEWVVLLGVPKKRLERHAPHSGYCQLCGRPVPDTICSGCKLWGGGPGGPGGSDGSEGGRR